MSTIMTISTITNTMPCSPHRCGAVRTGLTKGTRTNSLSLGDVAQNNVLRQRDLRFGGAVGRNSTYRQSDIDPANTCPRCRVATRGHDIPVLVIVGEN